MVGVGNGDGERVGGVRAGDHDSGEEALDHEVDLGLVGVARPDHCFLDQPCGIFADKDARARGDHEHDAAGLGELERRLGVLVDEDFFRSGGVGMVVGEERVELGGEVGEALGERLLGVGLELPIGEVGEAIALGTDQAVAGRGERWIEPEDNQPSRSITSSVTS